MSSTAKALLLWGGICLVAFLAFNVVWSRTTNRLRPEGGVELAPNITFLKEGRLQLERIETRGWPMAFAVTRSIVADQPGGRDAEEPGRFYILPLALNLVFFLALYFLLVSLFGMPRTERFSWKLALAWCVCLAVLAGIGLAPPRTFL